MRPGLLSLDPARDPRLGAGGTASGRQPAASDLETDLGLDRVLSAMSRGDAFIHDVVRSVVLSGSEDVGDLRHRQAVVRDAAASPAAIRELYGIATHAVETERGTWGAGLRSPELALRRSVGVLRALLGDLRAAREVLERDGSGFSSPGLLALTASVRAAVDDAFLAHAEDLLARLDERAVIATARLGPGNRGIDYVLRRGPDASRRLRDRVAAHGRGGLVVDLTLRDQNALNALGELRARALDSTGVAVRDATASVLGFVQLLRIELAFLVGCVNLGETLGARGIPTCFAELVTGPGPAFTARDLVDPGLALATGGPLVGNDVDADGRALVVVTGANGGGKSTLLRAVGLAHVMAQAGMFVAASSLRMTLHAGVLTHFTRDEGLDTGRLEAELTRLSALVGSAEPTSLVLLNEALSSTNERDGSAIAADVVTGLADGGTTVWYVTHLHELAVRLEASGRHGTLFLRAERGSGGDRPFRVVEAPPLATSFGRDVYERVMRGRVGR